MFKPLCLALSLIAVSAFAQNKTTTIEFGPEADILGSQVGPDAEVVTPREAAKHGSLIRVREEFKAKVLESFKEL